MAFSLYNSFRTSCMMIAYIIYEHLDIGPLFAFPLKCIISIYNILIRVCIMKIKSQCK